MNKKIIVLGSPGSGKTWLSDKLGEFTGLQVFHLDDYYWLDRWINLPPKEWSEQINILLEHDAFIMDGNYEETIAARLAKADHAIYVQRSLIGCIYGYTRRCIINIIYRGKELPKNIMHGKTKRITDNGYFNFVWYIIKYHLHRERRLLNELKKTGKLTLFKYGSDIYDLLKDIQ